MLKASLKLKKWWEFLIEMTIKEIKVRYKMAILGFLWMFLNPLLQMLVVGFVFQFFLPIKVDNYFLFLFSGLLIWNFFSYTVSKNTPMIVNERMLIKKAKFPRETIILSVVLSNLFHLLISLPILIIITIILGKLNGFWFLLSPLILLLLTLLISGLSLMCSAWNTKYRDVNFMVSAIMPLWFYATPIVYDLNLLPNKISKYFYLNPMTGITELFRFLILGTPMYSLKLSLLSIVSSIFILGVGIYIFKKEEPLFCDWV